MLSPVVHEQFFCLGSAYLSNKPKTKAQAISLFINKQTNMNEFFIESNSSCSWLTWFVYSPRNTYYWFNKFPTLDKARPLTSYVMGLTDIENIIEPCHVITWPRKEPNIEISQNRSALNQGLPQPHNQEWSPELVLNRTSMQTRAWKLSKIMVNIPGTRLYMEEDSVYYTVYESTRVTFTQLF